MFPCPAVYVPAKRNGGQLLTDPDNFIYNVSRKTDKTVYYVCQKLKQHGCKVMATVKKSENGDVIMERRGEHEHDTDLLKEKAKQVLREEV